MNILITGGTGFIGTPLSRELRNAGHTVVVTTRRPSDSKDKLTWDPPALISADTISEFDAVINLAGEPIAPGRWTKKRKELIMSSRVNTTRALVDSMKKIIPPRPPLEKGGFSNIPLFDKEGSGEILKGLPKVLISASAIGYYGDHRDEYVTEDTPPASDFLAEVCKAWEAEALRAQEFDIRVVLVRIGGVLESDGGALPEMMVPFKFFLGGPIGSGKQWFSWIHRDDVVGIIKHALENESVSGPVNAAAPNPVTNKEFSSALGKTLGRPSWLAVPGFIVKLTLGELGGVLLTGQRVLPEKALKAGYHFKYTEVNEALAAILRGRK
ncbi:MAG: TIGR01777 family protein [Nitrospirae bacterium]|nr:TIGR01777 family protein [Nitrospirota bacterium]